MALQYIGARYVVKIYTNTTDPSTAEWQPNVNYEPLTLVTFNNGSYLSKKDVLANVGNPAENPDYWVQTGFYNGQIAELQTLVSNLQDALANEKNVREYEDSQLSTAIRTLRTETNDAIHELINADTAIRTDLSTEATTRSTADAGLSTRISTNAGNIATEISNRTSADANLQHQIDEIIAPSGEAPSAAEVENARIGVDGKVYASLGGAIRGQIENIDDVLEYNLNLIELTANAYINTSGATVDVSNPVSANGWYYGVIDCAEGDIVSVCGAGSGSARLWAFADVSNNIISSAPVNTTYSVPTEVVAPTNAVKCVINTEGAYYSYKGRTVKNNNILLPDGIKILNSDIIHDRDYLIVPQSNLYDKNTAINGYYNSDGTFTASDNYKTNSEKIKVNKGDNIAISAYCRISCFFDLYGKLAKFDIYGTATDTHILTAPVDGDLYLCVYANYVADFMAAKGTIVQTYSPYKKILQNDIEFNTNQLDVISSYVNPSLSGNILYNKKYVACGDSFTHGDFQYSLTNDYTFTDGLYAGEYKVYPFFIGRRNSMVVVNEAQNGSTMGYTGSDTLSFSAERYKNIPADADYITLNFGINDDTAHSNTPLGVKTDNVNTTFWGAWNIVMNYIIRNHPMAKIGIIVPNGCEEAYCEVVRQVAEYWGVPYLDIPKNPQVPLNIRCYDKTGTVNAAIENFRNDYWYVNNNSGTRNLHPNELCHEYESTYIENWLKSL